MSAPRENTRESRAGLGCTGLYIIAGFGLIISATVLCNYIKLTGTDENGQAVSLVRGIWKGQAFDGDGCGNFDGLDLGTRWKSAQAMSILGCFTAAMAIWPLVCACGKQLTLPIVLNIGSNAMWSCLWSGLTLLMLSSNACKADFLTDVTCAMDTGAKCAIAATVLFFVASMSISCSIATAAAIAIVEEEKGAQAEEKV